MKIRDKFTLADLVSFYLLIILLLFILLKGCTTSPNGAINYDTTSYYVDGKFHEDLPEEYIIKNWGNRLEDALGKDHAYRSEINISHQRTEAKWCTVHKGWENIRAVYNGKDYFYWVSNHKRF